MNARLRRIMKVSVISLCGAAVAVLWVLVVKDIRGSHDTGYADSMGDVPIVGEYLADFDTQGVVSYAYYKSARRYTVLISGKTSFERVRSFCDRQPLDLYPERGSVVDRSQSMDGFRADPSSFATEFSDVDAFARGAVYRAGLASLNYRYADGKFFMRISR